MKVKVRNFFELILQALVLILGFIPSFYQCEEWIDDKQYIPTMRDYVPIQTLSSREDYSLFDSLFNTDGIIMIVGMALFATFLLGSVFYFIQLTGTGAKRNWKPTVVLAVIETVLFTACSILIETNDWTHMDSEYQYSLQTIFFVMAAALLLLTVLTIFGYCKAAKLGLVEEEAQSSKVVVVNNSTNADELKKYKDLLDSGAISQEEYDEKKKQLLGL